MKKYTAELESMRGAGAGVEPRVSDRFISGTTPAPTTRLMVCGIDVTSLRTEKRVEIQKYGAYAHGLGWKGNDAEIRAQIKELTDVLKSPATKGETRLMCNAKLKILRETLSSPVVQSILILKNGTIDQAKKAYSELLNLYEKKVINYTVWKEAMGVFSDRPDSLRMAKMVKETCDLVITTPTPTRDQYRIDQRLTEAGMPLIASFHFSLGKTHWDIIENHIKGHLAITTQMAAEKKISWDEWNVLRSEYVQHIINHALVGYGFGEHLVQEMIPQRLAPLIALAKYISETERAIISALLGDSAKLEEIGYSISDWIGDYNAKVKENPREVGRNLGRTVTSTVYTLASSSDAQTQAIISNSKRMIGLANAFSFLGNCIII